MLKGVTNAVEENSCQINSDDNTKKHKKVKVEKNSKKLTFIPQKSQIFGRMFNWCCLNPYSNQLLIV
jgi:hypothetical protein